MYGKIKQSTVLGAVVMTLLGPLALLAQNSGIIGSVTDQSGGLVAGVVVTATKLRTGETRRTVSDSTGQYSMPNLDVGVYRLVAEHEGFQRSVIDQVSLEVQLTRRVDFALQLGAQAQTVSVTAKPAVLQTAQSSVGTVLENKMVTEMPLNGRNFLQLQLLLPGVTTGRNGFFATVKIDSQTTSIGGGAFSVDGQRPIYNDFLLDGVSFKEWENNTNAFNPSIDAIQEFRTQTSNYSAEFGVSAGGLVNMVMKSGSNQFHGSAYEFVRNDKFDAASFFTNRVHKQKPPLRRNQFGGTLGGPIIRDNSFFFVSYEGFREARASTLIGTFPTAAMTNGDFSQLLSLPKPIVINDPVTGVPFPGNIIPPNRILSFWPGYFKTYVPLPNSPGLRNNYAANASHLNKSNNLMGRLDHRFSDKLSLGGHYVYNRVLDVPLTINPEFGDTQHSRSQNVTANATWIKSPTTVIDLRSGYSLFWQDLKNDRAGTTPYIARDIMHIQGVPNTLETSDAPFLSVAGFSAVGSGTISEPRKWINERWEEGFSVYSHRGKHDVKWGVQWMRFHNTFPEAIIPNGIYSFNGIFSGYPMADLMLGIPASWVASPTIFDPQLRGSVFMPWIQDDWRVTPNLTLNLGLRYEWAGRPYSKHGNLSNLVIPAGGGIVTDVVAKLCDTTVFPCPTGGLSISKSKTPSTLNNDNNDFAPRIGFAYRLGGRTVLRGGYGVFYSREMMGRSTVLAISAPFVTIDSVTNNLSNFQSFSFSNPYANLPAFALGFGYANPNSRDAYLQAWNLAVQRELGAGVTLEVGYVGNKGTKQESTTLPNQPFPGPGSIQARRPYTNVGSLGGEEAFGNSNYHGLQVKAEKRFSHGLSFLSSYTWSKARTDNCDFEWTVAPSGGCIQDQHNRRATWGLAQPDQRNRFVMSSLYALPFGSGQHFLSNTSAVVGKMVSGWQLGWIVTLAAGQPLTATLTFDNPNVSEGIKLPNRVSNPNNGPKTIDQWFNTSAFTVPPPYTFGNAGIGTITGPGISSMDFSILKNTPITERVNLQFRSEFFNLMNHPIWGDPNTSFGTPQFGTITGLRYSAATREIQFSLRLEF